MAKATMHDVARLAGVSQSTVSHYVNGTRAVHPDTQAAIQQAIDQTGYVHDARARSLRTGRSNTVGLAISAISNPYFGNLVRGIEQRVTESGRTMLLVDTHDEVEAELRAVDQLLQQRPDAVLLAPAAAASPALDRLVARSVPTVLVDRVPPELPDHVDAVGVVNRAPVRRLVAHLVDLGHRNIAMLAGVAGIPTTIERVQGFHDGMDDIDGPHTSRVEHAVPDADGTAAAIARLLAADPRPTALVCGNNQATISALTWLRAEGIDVPDDLSLVSYDDFEWSDLFHPRLTAISQPVAELADTAAQLLAERIDDPSAPGRVVRLEPELVVRDSARAV